MNDTQPNTPTTAAALIEEPQHGGSYMRNEDGSLTLVERTQPRGEADAADAAAAAVHTSAQPNQ